MSRNLTAQQPVADSPIAKVRNYNVTIAKGVGIILMVIGHSGAPGWLHNFIYAFHMPLFFILAGYCFKVSHLSHPWQFTQRRLKGLWWPFVKWNLLFMLVHNWFQQMNMVECVYGLRDFKHRLGWYAMMNHAEALLGGFWFLGGLFVASMIGWGVIRLSKGQPVKVAWATLALAVVTAVANIWVTSEPTGHKPTNFLLYVVFFLCGFLLASAAKRKPEYAGGAPVWLIVTFLSVLSLVSWFFPYGIAAFFTWELPIYVAGGVAGTLATLCLASRMRDGWLRRFLIFAGDSSMAVLVWHFLCFKGVTALLLHLDGKTMEELTAFPVHYDYSDRLWLLYTVVGVMVPLAMQAGYLILKKKLSPHMEQLNLFKPKK